MSISEWRASIFFRTDGSTLSLEGKRTTRMILLYTRGGGRLVYTNRHPHTSFLFHILLLFYLTYHRWFRFPMDDANFCSTNFDMRFCYSNFLPDLFNTVQSFLKKKSVVTQTSICRSPGISYQNYDFFFRFTEFADENHWCEVSLKIQKKIKEASRVQATQK